MLKIVLQGKTEDQIQLIHTIANNGALGANKSGHNLLCEILRLHDAEKILRNPIGNAAIRNFLENEDIYSENFIDIRRILKTTLHLKAHQIWRFELLNKILPDYLQKSNTT